MQSSERVHKRAATETPSKGMLGATLKEVKKAPEKVIKMTMDKSTRASTNAASGLGDLVAAGGTVATGSCVFARGDLAIARFGSTERELELWKGMKEQNPREKDAVQVFRLSYPEHKNHQIQKTG
ncbi:hypothetical protein MMC10_009527 [Thelotrema lepadinum]|nr:hypothetical protein [Thelotrema lepadinum]